MEENFLAIHKEEIKKEYKTFSSSKDLDASS
jgi:hypothetical protein